MSLWLMGMRKGCAMIDPSELAAEVFPDEASGFWPTLGRLVLRDLVVAMRSGRSACERLEDEIAGHEAGKELDEILGLVSGDLDRFKAWCGTAAVPGTQELHRAAMGSDKMAGSLLGMIASAIQIRSNGGGFPVLG